MIKKIALFLVLSSVSLPAYVGCLMIQEHVDGIMQKVASADVRYTEKDIWSQLSDDPKILCEPSVIKELGLTSESVFPYRFAAFEALNSMNEVHAGDCYEADNPVQSAIEALEIRLFELCKIYCEEKGSTKLREDSNALYQSLKDKLEALIFLSVVYVLVKSAIDYLCRVECFLLTLS